MPKDWVVNVKLNFTDAKLNFSSAKLNFSSAKLNFIHTGFADDIVLSKKF